MYCNHQLQERAKIFNLQLRKFDYKMLWLIGITLLLLVSSSEALNIHPRQSRHHIAAIGDVFETQWQATGITTNVYVTKNNQIIQPEDRHHEVTFDPDSGVIKLGISPVKIEDQGTYRAIIEDSQFRFSSEFVLEVENEIPTTLSQSASTTAIKLEFKTKPNPIQNISSGCDIELKLVYSGGPANITVTHNNDILKNGNNCSTTLDKERGILELKIDHVTVESEGAYRVIITNQVHMDNLEFVLEVNNRTNNDSHVTITCSPTSDDSTEFRLLTNAMHMHGIFSGTTSRPHDISSGATSSGTSKTLVSVVVVVAITVVILGLYFLLYKYKCSLNKIRCIELGQRNLPSKLPGTSV